MMEGNPFRFNSNVEGRKEEGKEDPDAPPMKFRGAALDLIEVLSVPLQERLEGEGNSV